MESFGVLFGRLVRKKRGIEDLSQDALAGKTDLTKARISEIETGKVNNPQVRTIDALCVALNRDCERKTPCFVCLPCFGPHAFDYMSRRRNRFRHFDNQTSCSHPLSDSCGRAVLYHLSFHKPADGIAAHQARLLLPQPFGPTRATTRAGLSPRSIVRSRNRLYPFFNLTFLMRMRLLSFVDESAVG
jgi:transcriptional regulator with XRE-family HTH domain